MDNLEQFKRLKQAALDIKNADCDIVDVLLIQNPEEDVWGFLIVDSYAEEFDNVDEPTFIVYKTSETYLFPYPRIHARVTPSVFKEIKSNKPNLLGKILLKESLINA